MRFAALPLAALLAGAPAAASAPAFFLAVECDGAMPTAVRIAAFAPGVTAITVEQMLALCASQAPAEPQRNSWQGTT